MIQVDQVLSQVAEKDVTMMCSLDGPVFKACVRSLKSDRHFAQHQQSCLFTHLVFGTVGNWYDFCFSRGTMETICFPD